MRAVHKGTAFFLKNFVIILNVINKGVRGKIMEELSFQVIILLIAFGFLAAFIDSVVGGEG